MRRVHLLSLMAFGAGLALTGAQEMGTPSVTIEEHEELGSYLTDAEGRSLYLFTNDEQGGASNCYERCAENWPPLLVDGDPTAGEGATQELLDTVERDDGSLQATYNGWPLYYFARDEEPGDTAGQAVGDVWYLLDPDGNGIGAPEAAEAEDGAEEGSSDDLMAHGATVYQSNCSFCHGDEGGGGEGPRLARNSGLGNDSAVLRQIMRGGEYMPAFGNILSDAEIAAVATFIRNSWENSHGPISEEDVAGAR